MHVYGRKTFFDFFPVPRFLAFSNSGVAITDDVINFIEFKIRGPSKELELLHHYTFPAPEGAIEAGFVHDPKILGESLRELREQYGVRYVSAALPDEKAYLFTTMIDKASAGNLDDAVAFIIEENAPVTLAQSIFSFEIVGDKETKDKIKVAVSVLSSKKVEMYSQAIKNGGITPISFDLESQAIARAVIPHGDNSVHLLVNIGKFKTGFYVAENKIIQFSSTASIGATGNANSLNSEMRKIFSYWNNRPDDGFSSGEIKRVIVCGAEASQEDFVRELMEEVEAEWRLADVWVNAFSIKNGLPEISFEESLGFATAIGLALPRGGNFYV